MKLSRNCFYALAATLLLPGAAGAALPAASSQVAASSIRMTGKLADKPAVGDNAFTLTVTNPDGSPAPGAKVTLSVAMTNMDMGVAHPTVHDEGAGRYTATANFGMAGPWRITAKVEAPGRKAATKSFDFAVGAKDATPETSMPGMSMPGMSMLGKLGPWGMQREGSGTSWLPDSSPMFMKALPKAGRYEVDLMGFFTLNYSSSGGPRGDQRFYSNSMPMLMARRETGGGILGMNLMISLDPIFNGEYGYPNLFQTGETAYGHKLVDYQHPHDLISEVTASYSHPVGNGVRAFVYGGPVGEPALGGPTFAHRPSGMEIPEAPISHHWFDSTHISFGVVTAGLNTARWQVEASAFNGHEPDENRYSPDPVQLNSASGRLTYNPSRDFSFNVAYGWLNSPESTEPGVDQHRLTAAGVWSLPLRSGDNLSVTGLFGRNIVQGANSDAYLLEGTYLTGRTSIFARWENVDKDELVGVPAGNYNVNKFLVGAVRNLATRDGLEYGLGAYAGFYGFPASLDPYYGRSPVTLGVFFRIRPARM